MIIYDFKYAGVLLIEGRKRTVENMISQDWKMTGKINVDPLGSSGHLKKRFEPKAQQVILWISINSF